MWNRLSDAQRKQPIRADDCMQQLFTNHLMINWKFRWEVLALVASILTNQLGISKTFSSKQTKGKQLSSNSTVEINSRFSGFCLQNLFFEFPLKTRFNLMHSKSLNQNIKAEIYLNYWTRQSQFLIFFIGDFQDKCYNIFRM